MTTLEALRTARPARPVTLPGGASVFVRSLTVAEILAAEQLAERDEEPSRPLTYLLAVAALALAEGDGRPSLHVGDEAELAAGVVTAGALLTPEQLKAVAQAAVPTKADAKNG